MKTIKASFGIDRWPAMLVLLISMSSTPVHAEALHTFPDAEQLTDARIDVVDQLLALRDSASLLDDLPTVEIDPSKVWSGTYNSPFKCQNNYGHACGSTYSFTWAGWQ